MIEYHDPSKIRGKLWCSGRVSRPCSASNTRRGTVNRREPDTEIMLEMSFRK